MATPINNTYTTYDLSEEESLQGAILNDTQQQVLQTQLATYAEEKLAMPFDTQNPGVFAQQEAYKRGQMDAVTYILEMHAASIVEANYRADAHPDHEPEF